MLSTAEARSSAVVSSAVTEFARTGYLGTPIASVAAHAKISPAYVFKLFPSKERLFVAALDHCFELVVAALERGADAASSHSPHDVLDAMGLAYAELIADRELLMLQVHAQSAADIPEIGESLRRGLERVTTFASSRSRADDKSVQRFIAYGQLCHLIVTAGLDSQSGAWAAILTDGIRHP
jgi:AcrR family transcriptional regulator